jgi:hypothetical protein
MFMHEKVPAPSAYDKYGGSVCEYPLMDPPSQFVLLYNAVRQEYYEEVCAVLGSGAPRKEKLRCLRLIVGAVIVDAECDVIGIYDE